MVAVLLVLFGAAVALGQQPDLDEVVRATRPGMLDAGSIAVPASAEVSYESSRLVVARLAGDSASEVRTTVQQALEDSGLDVHVLPTDFLADGARVMRWDGDTCGVVDVRPRDGLWEVVYSRAPDCT